MRVHGTLTKWNDDRGFGFITPAQGDDEIFVHISAFPKDGSRPSISEPVSFEVELGDDSKKRAVRVLYPSRQITPRSIRRTTASKPRRNPLSRVLGLLVIGAIGVSAYSSFWPNGSATLAMPEFVDEIVDRNPEPAVSAQTFQCDGRTHCSQMTSCAEAEYFLRHCPDTRMDGNHDGEPCEQQWCN
ncbi:cold shock domain-containing protein [Thiocystis violascens]|uniref:Cold shock protein n=1 Tax=Thiocystis violascens (strain ATCC 17096 / DSM 198 / 6111) TaxID=765911 RepID=I3YCB6_THIV6|nr:cold shock domain-containing protein [Thiocystis violascens]AFL74634.1 cold shock protein [Thiocystis violascens DSM 198]